MYEQDYVMRMNKDVVGMIAMIVFGKKIEALTDIVNEEEAGSDKTSSELFCEQGDISENEGFLLQALEERKSRALERLILFYAYLNDKSEDYLKENHYSHERIREGLDKIANNLGISDVIRLF